MTPTDLYLTIAKPVTAELRERASKFKGYAFPLRQEEDWSLHLDTVRQEHPKATHHCYAFRFGPGTDLNRANDDGEPSGSAGKPILGQIDSFGLSNILVVVVRYYGGTKLGVPGLIQAYRETARLALQEADIMEAFYQTTVQVTGTYSIIPAIMQVGKQFEWTILDQGYTATGQTIVADIRQSDYSRFWASMQMEAGGMYPDEVKEGLESELIKIERITNHA
ncbi:MAG: YigZ family protein [Saprospiraceae bacterium]